MKKNTKVLFPITILLVTLLLTQKASAQDQKQVVDSTATIKLAKELSVSRTKALEIQQAYAAFHNDMEAMVKDSKLTPQNRRRWLSYYQNLRRRHINAVVTQEQKSMLQHLHEADIQQEAERRKQLEAKHQQEMSQTAN